MTHSTDPDFAAALERDAEKLASIGTDPGPTIEELDDGWEWAVVEIFGHRRHAGRIREIERFGAKMLRIDIPKDGVIDGKWETILYAGGSIFSMVPSTEDAVMKINKPYSSPYRLSAPKEEIEDEEMPF